MSKAKSTALGGVLCAGSLAILWIAGLSPTGQVGLTGVAGIVPIVATLLGGRILGYLCWFATSSLGLLLLPNKGVALLYFLFFGWYPVWKSRLECSSNRVIEWGMKLLSFTGAYLLIWFVFQDWMLLFLPEKVMELGMLTLYGLGVLLFLCYDVGLSYLIGALVSRLPRDILK